MSSVPPVPVPRIAARGRPFEDPRCGGCHHLALLRAVRRAGLAVRGGLGCEPPVDADRATLPARVARFVGAAEAMRDPAALLRDSGDVALLAIADRAPSRTDAVTRALAAAGARWVEVPAQATAAEAERLVLESVARGPVALVALAPCARSAPTGPPLQLDPARCNRCGSCLSLGCVALSDRGGDAIAIDAARCTGCGVCAPLCRAGALRRP